VKILVLENDIFHHTLHFKLITFDGAPFLSTDFFQQFRISSRRKKNQFETVSNPFQEHLLTDFRDARDFWSIESFLEIPISKNLLSIFRFISHYNDRMLKTD
jgi:hypothetical protein